MTGSVERPGFVVGYNPVPMANEVATQQSKLRTSLLFLLLGAALWSAVWWSQREQWGSPWLLVAGYSVSLVLLLVTLVRLLSARHHLARIGSGPALVARRGGLELHSLDGERVEVAWADVESVRTGGRKVGAGPQVLVQAGGRRVWQVPLSFLDALPGTIDGGLRACSGGRVGLDLSSLDNII